MIALKDAQKTNFQSSTKGELRAYAEQLGIDFSPTADAKTLKKLIFSALGIAMNPEGNGAAAAPVVTLTRGGNTIFPTYNLSPNGVWGGRRHRMSIPKPEGAKLAQAEGFAWNGKHTYYLPYDEVEAVPEPIYQIIATNRRRIPKSVKPEGAEMGEITTGWEFVPNSMHYIGVDPVTADRAGSLMEWYQSRGTKWFEDKDERQLAQIAQKCEVSVNRFMGIGQPLRPLTVEELRSRLIEFFFGYADAEAEPNEAILA